jgi:hypothetical protein
MFGAISAGMTGPTRIHDLDAAWGEPHAGAQLRAVRRTASTLRERFAAGPRCIAVRTLPLATLAYPTKFAFAGAASVPWPLVSMTHRCLLVQLWQKGELKNLLFNPTDIEAARATPYLAKLAAQFGERLTDLIGKRFEPLEDQLARLGLLPADIDYVAFDHFHTQDLRRLLGTASAPPRFPNAKLLAPRVEWEDWNDVHPFQRAWYIADGKRGVRMDNVALLQGDHEIGDGVWLLRTPGHTSGNQTLFVNTASGVWGISENGTCADNWSPLASKIRGVRAAAKKQGVDIVMNMNTPELGAIQYTSMVLESTIVDRVGRAPAFVQMFPSSEVTASLIAPGLEPTIVHRAIEHGEVVRPRVRESGRSAEASA